MPNLTETEKTYKIHWAWVILAVCFCNLFINYSIRLGYGVVLPEMIRDLEFSRTAGGSIYNAYLFVYIALTPFTGFLTDRLGARRVIAVCSLILGTGVLLMGNVKSLSAACIFYAIVGLGSTGMWTPVITVVQRWFSPNKRGLALGIISTGYGLGFGTMGAAFPWIVQQFNWRFAWYFLGAAALLMFLFNSLFLRSDPSSAGFEPWGEKDRVDPGKILPAEKPSFVKLVFNYKPFWIIGLSYLCIAYSLYGITTFMVDFAKYEMGLPLSKASFLATIHGICQIIGVLTILPLSDYLGRKKTILISNLAITITLTSILFAGHSWILLYILVAILAVFYGVTFPIYGACAGDYFPRALMGSVIGAWTPFYGIGAILAHWVGGILRDTTGSYSIAFSINAVMAALGLCIFFALKKGKS
ncbi:MAG: MFS transporter [Desulfobacterales bacterium]|nr:MFS transporter [Deltaproteobacteria bacterium]NNL42357.1 MFS transporter [Desulfobacterales bacterium]